MPLKILAEAVGRIEHKLDLLITMVRKMPSNALLRLPAVGEPGLTCPLCGQSVNYDIDARAEVCTRRCGCKTGKTAPIKLEPLPSPGARRHGNDRSEE